MPSDSPQLAQLSSSELLQSGGGREEDALQRFVRSAVYSGIQSPINGAVQLWDRATGSNVLPAAQFIDAPQSNDLATAAGSLTATAGHVALMLYAGHKIAGPGDTLAGFGRRLGVTSSFGAVYGGVLNPVHSEDGFVAGRLSNALRGAAGMAGVSAASTVYRDLIGKGTSFLDAPHYHALVVPGTLAGLPLMADTAFRGNARRESSVFLPSAKLMPVQDLLRPEDRFKK